MKGEAYVYIYIYSYYLNKLMPKKRESSAFAVEIYLFAANLSVN